MGRHDAEAEMLLEIRELKEKVSCAVLLERLGAGWVLDKAESTRNCLKYRRGGEVLIVNHQGRGWWDPHRAWDDRQGRGDVFTLAQRLQPELNFGQVRRVLRGLIGVRPAYPLHGRERGGESVLPVTERWARRPLLSRGSAVWRYLAGTRGLPDAVLLAASRTDAVREGARASAWFAHRDHAGRLTGIEMRGPLWRGFAKCATKTLFRLPGCTAADTGAGPRPARLCVTEAAIEAMSLAALEGLRADTLYLGVAGGMGPETVRALQQLLGERSGDPVAVMVAATNADAAGERYAERLAAMAGAAAVRSERLPPTGGENDFNDALRKGRGVA